MERIPITRLVWEPWHQDTYCTWDQQQLRVFEAIGNVHAVEGHMFTNYEKQFKPFQNISDSHMFDPFKRIQTIFQHLRFPIHSKQLKTSQNISKHLIQTFKTFQFFFNIFRFIHFSNNDKPCQDTCKESISLTFFKAIQNMSKHVCKVLAVFWHVLFTSPAGPISLLHDGRLVDGRQTFEV